MPTLTRGAELVAIERNRQMGEEGFSREHDRAHRPGELARAGASYALYVAAPLPTEATQPPWLWPWSKKDFKPGPILRTLVKAAALLVAEIDRILDSTDAEDRRVAEESHAS